MSLKGLSQPIEKPQYKSLKTHSSGFFWGGGAGVKSTKLLFFPFFLTNLFLFSHYFFVPHFSPISTNKSMWIFVLPWSSDLEQAEGRWTLVSVPSYLSWFLNFFVSLCYPR